MSDDPVDLLQRSEKTDESAIRLFSTPFLIAYNENMIVLKQLRQLDNPTRHPSLITAITSELGLAFTSLLHSVMPLIMV